MTTTGQTTLTFKRIAKGMRSDTAYAVTTADGAFIGYVVGRDGGWSTQPESDPLTPVGQTYDFVYAYPSRAYAANLLLEEWTDATGATQAPAREARTWDATTAETHTCAGACGKTLPAKSFPTTGKDGRRGVVCRADRDAARTSAA
jgi:hypothetical protein